MHSIITFDAIVDLVPNMSSRKISMKSRDLLHFGAHFHIFLRKSMGRKDSDTDTDTENSLFRHN